MEQLLPIAMVVGWFGILLGILLANSRHVPDEVPSVPQRDPDAEAAARIEAVRGAARELGLTEVVEGVFEGERGGRPVTVRTAGSDPVVPHKLGTDAVLTAGGVHPDVRLVRTSRTEGQPTGDPTLDRLLQRSGDEQLTLAALDEATRRQARALYDRSPFEVSREAVRQVRSSGRIPRDAAELAEALDALVAMADRLDLDPADCVRRLRGLVATDPIAAVRLAALQHLFTTHGSAADPAARDALHDDAAEIRTVAAVHLGEAFPLLTLAEDERLAPELRARALAALGELPAGDRMVALAVHLLEGGDPMLQRAALRAVRTAEPDRLRPVVEALQRRAYRPDVHLVAVHVLERTEDREGLRGLVGEGQEVAVAALAALGRVGTPDDVAALKPLTTERRREVRQGALDAIRAIQARMGPDAGGRLTLSAEPQHGGLTVSAQEGAMSVAEARRRPKDKQHS